jgi:hypothetical protein
MPLGGTVNPSSRTELASGQLNDSGRLVIELIERPGKATVVAISWPSAPTVTSPRQFDQIVAATMRILSSAVVELGALRVHKRL